ncbi:prepilin-type N-terminal cleavage/methylation domain-containing protein [Microbacterium sp. cf046]|uniref:type IV pilus modification PilV family protein n=1 Tax=Microbacterium sp. cf046 TaxID=1761803 RepID=UPI0008E9BB7E|nr:type II secretion system protein [Microbacterium sp. cf046]SFS02590.1 prepilin-type N-terminal cleavage/methylation domain-containing protein [Microbacterium sp. cf046]
MKGQLNSNDGGFSIIEVIVAMFLLAIVAVSLLPALFQGIQYSSQQSAVATATRELNALVEEARATPSCATLASVAASRTFTDGGGRTLTSSGSVGTCTLKTAVTLTLSVVDSSGTTMATTTARVFIQ